MMVMALLAGLAVPAAAQTGILVVAHGADSGWDAPVKAVVKQVKWNGPVQLAFLMGDDAASLSLANGARELVRAGAKRIVVVPFMVSTWGGHVRQIESAVATGKTGGPDPTMGGMSMGPPETLPAVPTRVTGALDSAGELGAAFRAQWQQLSAVDRHRPLMLVAHGPDTDAEAALWISNIKAATRDLASQLADHAVHVGLLRDDAPAPVRAAAVAGIRDTIMALARASGDSVMVMTVLISSGSINETKVPTDLVGMPMHYDGSALAPNPALARWIERTVAAVTW
jgi:sirohydrochlorin ferrochelatase